MATPVTRQMLKVLPTLGVKYPTIPLNTGRAQATASKGSEATRQAWTRWDMRGEGEGVGGTILLTLPSDAESHVTWMSAGSLRAR